MLAWGPSCRKVKQTGRELKDVLVQHVNDRHQAKEVKDESTWPFYGRQSTLVLITHFVFVEKRQSGSLHSNPMLLDKMAFSPVMTQDFKSAFSS